MENPLKPKFQDTAFSQFPKALLKSKVAELANDGIYIGTSSWKYEGWRDLLYDEQRYITRKRFSRTQFAEKCLAEYAETFKTVGVDATYYQFPTVAFIKTQTDLVPSDFQFGLKVSSDITVKNFPKLPQHGDKGGKSNAQFLNASLFTDQFLAPLEEARSQVGIIMFEFSQFREDDYKQGREFLGDLDAFLGKLPSGWPYAVEIRNRNFLQPEYFEILRRHKVTHLFNAWTRMPPVAEQLKIQESRTAETLAARFLLAEGRAYEDAVKTFSPYTEMKEPNPEGRQAGKALIAEAKAKKKKAFIFVNNRFEGNALQTILGMLS